MAVTRRRTKAKTQKKQKTTRLKSKPKSRLRPKVARKKVRVPKASSPPPVNLEAEVLARVAAQEQRARQRVAAFMGRTMNVPWVRERISSFEVAIRGGLRNLLAESAKDLVEGRLPESREAVSLFLFGLFSSLRTVFYREAMNARAAAISTDRGSLVPTREDMVDAVYEAHIYNNAAQREDVLENFRAKLSLARAGRTNLDSLMEQARVYDTLNPNKGIPEA